MCVFNLNNNVPQKKEAVNGVETVDNRHYRK